MLRMIRSSSLFTCSQPRLPREAMLHLRFCNINECTRKHAFRASWQARLPGGFWPPSFTTVLSGSLFNSKKPVRHSADGLPCLHETIPDAILSIPAGRRISRISTRQRPHHGSFSGTGTDRGATSFGPSQGVWIPGPGRRIRTERCRSTGARWLCRARFITC